LSEGTPSREIGFFSTTEGWARNTHFVVAEIMLSMPRPLSLDDFTSVEAIPRLRQREIHL
jgi:hypothetical protein